MASKANSKAIETHVALLRGINVGGKNMLPMKDLVAMFSGAKCADVRSYIQSGNVIFCAAPDLAARVPDLIAKAIERDFGLSVPVVTRSLKELRRVLESNPFLERNADTSLLHVMFLQERPQAARVVSLDPARSPGDEFRLVGRDLFLRLTTGAAKTKLTNAYFDSKLATVSTVRNWNTVTKLVELGGA